MALSAARARKLLLSFDNVTEAPHFDRVAFKTLRRTFATLAGDGSDVNFMFDALGQETFCAMAPQVLAPVPGGWGRMGATRCELKRVNEALFIAAAEAAHARANQPRKRGRARR
ncbi:MAG TPA: MmcQ/YjbR family DNA-binding protein [Polyangia bacterium]|nr:MmcQ/YjbR family DNA-binding protein [Polyangia bacterium]